MNAAGFPTGMTTLPQYGYKCSLALADLTQLTDSSGTSLLNQAQIDAMVAGGICPCSSPNSFPNYGITD